MRTSFRRLAGASALVFALVAAYPAAASAGEGADSPRTGTARVQQVSGDSESTADAEGAKAAEAEAAKADKAAEAAEDGKAPGDGKIVDGVSPKLKEKPDGPKAAWGYQIMPSCAGLEGLIRQGANFWQGATETPGSGKPVECTTSLIADCFGTANAVGCNYGPGQMMLLSTQVSDFALLAAHEFGHEWHPHSAAGCMNWASAYEVMRPTIC
ncbi:hypothetical protein ACFPA8_05135 [Streptomyces ovatisporus]|uniref:Uncharacterized protein n=1 Tax=Streptomyces ovatisporus TaxID=1128682 RepID=A0ABV9A363_9ACTN